MFEATDNKREAISPVEAVDFRPMYLVALKRWLLMGGLAVTAIWIDGVATGTLDAYFAIAAPLAAPAFLGAALFVYLRPQRAELGAMAGFVVMTLYLSLAYVYAIIGTPWIKSYIIFSNAVWAGLLYFYANLFLGKFARVASLVATMSMTVLSAICLYMFRGLPPTWHGNRDFAVQPYIYSILSQWAMFMGSQVVAQLYGAMSESQQRNATLRSIMAEMAGHEIRTPLQAMMNNVDMLHLLTDRASKAGMGSAELQKVPRVVESLRRSVKQMHSVLDNTALALRPSTTLQPLAPEMEVFDLHALLDELLDDFSPRVRAKHLLLRLDDRHPAPAAIEADKTRITQIVANLISNAIKYTDHGEILVSAVADRRNSIVIEVRDTGIGVSESDRSRIFEPYFRSASARQKAESGSGLGLAVVKRELAVLGGSIALESQEGSGSAFIVRLPAQVRSFVPRGRPAGSTLTVLVVDDSEQFLAAARGMLDLEGFKSRVASGGSHALEILAAEPIDVAFLDLQMPGLNGFEVAERVRADPTMVANTHIPLIAMSAVENPERMGDMDVFSDFVRKPFVMNRELLERIFAGSSLGDRSRPA